VPWSTPFEDPIILPNGGQLLTLRDAATYITKLPKADHTTPEWQAATEALIPVAENGGPTMQAGHRRSMGVEPRPGIQSGSQGDALGQAEAEAGPMSVPGFFRTIPIESD
jgi:hypothetical protein